MQVAARQGTHEVEQRQMDEPLREEECEDGANRIGDDHWLVVRRLKLRSKEGS
jgi:hypothetical protein